MVLGSDVVFASISKWAICLIRVFVLAGDCASSFLLLLLFWRVVDKMIVYIECIYSLLALALKYQRLKYLPFDCKSTFVVRFLCVVVFTFPEALN